MLIVKLIGKHESNTLERFLDPQNFMYELALTEIHNGRKEEHWIWYIFPQLRGIGKSRLSYHYGIQNIAEAKSYYAHPILGKRLQEATQLLLHQDKDLVEIFGHLDAMKVRSCMTLFYHATGDKMFMKVIEKFFGGNEDDLTLTFLQGL